MNEVVADDVTVELACSVGSAEVSARELLELQPGQVLSLARPVGGAVDLVVGRTVIGRGELVDIDGELGVRVLSLAREPADAASTPAGDAASMPAGGATPDGSPNVKE